MAMLYFGWLKTTQTSHSGIMASADYVRMSVGETKTDIQRMFTSDYKYADCRVVLLTPVIEALLGFTKLGPTHFLMTLPPVITKLDVITEGYLNARAGHDGPSEV